jgi:hypothetical protein
VVLGLRPLMAALKAVGAVVAELGDPATVVPYEVLVPYSKDKPTGETLPTTLRLPCRVAALAVTPLAALVATLGATGVGVGVGVEIGGGVEVGGGSVIGLGIGDGAGPRSSPSSPLPLPPESSPPRCQPILDHQLLEWFAEPLPSSASTLVPRMVKSNTAIKNRLNIIFFIPFPFLIILFVKSIYP